jgi:uncharacterized repeat protein (TIGR01451 family)
VMVLALAVCVLSVLVFVASAQAQPGPAWRITAEAVPSDVPPMGKGLFQLLVENVGDVPSVAGSPVTVVDRLPEGMVAVQAGAFAGGSFSLGIVGVVGRVCGYGGRAHGDVYVCVGCDDPTGLDHAGRLN